MHCTPNHLIVTNFLIQVLETLILHPKHHYISANDAIVSLLQADSHHHRLLCYALAIGSDE